MEKRFDKRIIIDCPGTLFLSRDEIAVNIHDISREGILFETDAYGFCIEDAFPFQFVDDKNENIVSGNAHLVRVRRLANNTTAIGCRLSIIDPKSYIEKLEIKDAMRTCFGMAV